MKYCNKTSLAMAIQLSFTAALTSVAVAAEEQSDNSITQQENQEKA